MPWHAAIAEKAAANAAQIAPQLADDTAPANYYRALKDVAAWAPEDAIIIGEGASTMDIGRTQLYNSRPRHRLDAGSYGTMGIGMGFVVAAAVVHRDKPIISVSGDSAIGFSGMEMETVCRYQLPVKIVVFNNGGIGPGHATPPDNPLQNMRPNALIYGARYDKMMEAFGGKGFFIEEPNDLKGALAGGHGLQGPRARQRRDLPGVGPQAPAVQVAQLIGSSQARRSRGRSSRGGPLFFPAPRCRGRRRRSPSRVRRSCPPGQGQPPPIAGSASRA